MWLYQHPVPRDLDKVTIHYRVVEHDAVVDTSGWVSFELPIRAVRLPQEGRKRRGTTARIEAYDGPIHKLRRAAFTPHFSWWLRANAMDLAHYVVEELQLNQSSDPVTLLREFHADVQAVRESFERLGLIALLTPWPYYAATMKALAFAYFALLVRPKGPWDHKPEITPPTKCGENCLDAERGALYDNDLWSNFHFGFIGRAAGFTRDELLAGAGLAQALSDTHGHLTGKSAEELRDIIETLRAKKFEAALNKMLNCSKGLVTLVEKISARFAKGGLAGLDNPGDNEMIKAGMLFFEKIEEGKASLTHIDLLKLLRRNRSKLRPPEWRAGEGVPPARLRVKDNHY